MIEFWRAHAAELLRVAQFVFWLAGTIGATVATFTYFTTRRKNAAETLMKLEERFEKLRDFLPAIDPATTCSEKTALTDAVSKSLSKVVRNDAETMALAQLDNFLRFLLVGKAAVDTKVIKLAHLQGLYDYWYWAAQCQHADPNVRGYIHEYFPRLEKFLDKHFNPSECALRPGFNRGGR